jgi:hypothetical protein
MFTIEVVPDPDGARHYMVICKRGDTAIASWPVQTEADGVRQILGVLRGLAKETVDKGDW